MISKDQKIRFFPIEIFGAFLGYPLRQLCGRGGDVLFCAHFCFMKCTKTRNWKLLFGSRAVPFYCTKNPAPDPFVLLVGNPWQKISYDFGTMLSV